MLVGLLLGVIAYRNDLPMTMRSCFYPLLGNKVFGFFGDLIDTMSVVCTMFGVCTSLGIGVIQLNGGLRRLNSNIEDSIKNQIIIIWAVTALATASVVSGLKVGVRRLSEICFSVGMFLMLVVFFYDDTWYLLNLFVQSCGYYLQWIIQLGFHTDAFAQLGNAADGKEAPNWMDEWTIFYWGWWIAWSPFVGMFIARISKGRTIKQFITYTLTIPIIYSFMWFCIFGGAGIRMEREAALKGITCNSTLGGATSLKSDNGLYRLSCREKNDMWFDVISQYGGIGVFMSGVSLVAIVLYFVTSADSGSLIIDCLASNGDPDPPIVQRIFWAATEGATATALLKVGGQEALLALQTVSICAGLFYTIILNFMCVALWRSLKTTTEEVDENRPQFTTTILDPIYEPSVKRFCKTLLALIAPWWPLSKAASKIYDSKRWPYMIILAVPFYGCIILQALQVLEPGLAYIGWAILFGFFSYSTGIRANMRDKYDIEGNMIEDFFAVMLVYPLAAVQMEHHVELSQVLERDIEIGLTVMNGDSEAIAEEEKKVQESPLKGANGTHKRAVSADVHDNTEL